MANSSFPTLWALVLAGGDGTRLQSLTRLIAGAPIPKQYCRLVGDRSLLEDRGRSSTAAAARSSARSRRSVARRHGARSRRRSRQLPEAGSAALAIATAGMASPRYSR